MALKVYVADNVDTVIATVKSQGGTVSPNYISSVTSLPNILKRNLKEVVGGSESYAFSVAPLAIPTTHSSGNPQNSRSLDYDVVIANTDANTNQPLLVMDTGIATLQVNFKQVLFAGEDPADAYEEEYEEGEEEGSDANDTEIIFSIEDYEITSFDLYSTLKDQLVYEGLNLKNSVALSIPDEIGAITCRALRTINLDLQDAVYNVDLTNYEFSVTVPRLLTDEAVDAFKSVTIFRTVGDKDLKNNLRIAGAVTYLPALDTFYPNSNTTENIPNLRDYLVLKQRQSYAGYLVELGLNQGILLNNELRTEVSTTYTVTEMPDTFSKSSLSIFDSVSHLFSGTAVVITTTGEITNISIGIADDSTEEGWISHVSTSNLSIGNLQTVLEPYGVFARVSTTGGKTNKLVLQRMLFDAGQTETMSFRVTSSAEATIQTTPNLALLQLDDLPTATSFPVVRYTEYGEYDVDIDEVTEAPIHTTDLDLSVDTSTPMYDSLCTLYFKAHSAVQFKVNSATNRVYTQYSQASSLVEFVSQKTAHLSAYGYEDLLTTVANSISTKTGYAVSVDVVKGCLHINSSQKTQKNLYLSYKYSSNNTTPIEYVEPTVLNSQLKIDSGHVIRSETEALILMGDTFKSMPNTEHSCQYVVIDTAGVSEVTFIPFAYSVDGTLVREQSNYNFTISTTDFYRNFLVSDAIFFCNVFPIFENGVRTAKYVIILKDLVLDGKALRNLLVRTDSEKTGVLSQIGETTVGFTNTLQGVLQVTENDTVAFPSQYISLNKKSGVSLNYATECQFTLADLEGTLTIEVQDLDGTVETISTTYEIVEPPAEDPENTEPQPVTPTFTESLLTQLQESLYLDASESEGVVTLTLKNNVSSAVRLKVEDDAGALSMVSGAYELFGNTTRIILEKEVV